jgi:hypothetical protein
MSDRTAAFSNNSLTQEFQNLKLLDVNKVLKLEEEIEILREQAESFKQLLHQQNQKLQEITQELMHTNQELIHTNHELCIATNLQLLSPVRAKKLAKEIFSKTEIYQGYFS